MSRKPKRIQRDPRGEHWTKLLRPTMETPAWRALSSAAQALYPWLKLEWRGLEYNNNGRLRLSVRQAAAKMGVTPDTAAKAFLDLQRKGFVVQVEPARLGAEGSARAPAYEITELKMPATEGDGRQLYRQWKPGEDFPVHSSSPNNPAGANGRKTKPCHEKHDSAVMKSMTNDGGSVMKSMTGRHEKHDEQAISPSKTVMKSMTSLSYQTSAQESGPPRSGPLKSEQAARALSKAEKRALIREAVGSAAASMSVASEGDPDGF